LRRTADEPEHRISSIQCIHFLPTAPPSLGFFQSNAGAEAKKKSQKNPMWVNSKKRLTKSNETSDMKNGIRRKLMKLHAVDKEKPTKKLVGRERKATEKEGKGT
jgi:hypothetical protein